VEGEDREKVKRKEKVKGERKNNAGYRKYQWA